MAVLREVTLIIIRVAFPSKDRGFIQIDTVIPYYYCGAHLNIALLRDIDEFDLNGQFFSTCEHGLRFASIGSSFEQCI